MRNKKSSNYKDWRDKLDYISGWFTLIMSLIVVFIVLPWIFWIQHQHSIDLEERGKEGVAEVIKIRNLKGSKIYFRYTVNGKVMETFEETPYSDYKIKVGYKIKIIYDSLNASTVRVVWKNKKMKK